MNEPPASPNKGWYPDPAGSGRQRLWDGSQWTIHYSDQPKPRSRFPKPRRTRGVSAWLSLAAAGVTALILVAAILRDADHPTGWLRWVLSIGLPPIVLSVATFVQYRRGHSTGAGAAAAAVYWILLIVYNVRAADLYVIGAVLQTAAWFVSRPRPSPQAPDEVGAMSERS